MPGQLKSMSRSVFVCALLALMLSLLLQPPIATGQGPDPTPTPDALVPLTQPLPELEPVTAANADRLTEVGVPGRGIVGSFAWSPDGLTLAVSAGGEFICLYALDALDAPLRVLRVPIIGVGNAAFTPHGLLLITGGESVRLYGVPRME